VLMAATWAVPSAHALAQLGPAVAATRVQPGVQPSVQPGIQPDWSALPGQKSTAPASAVAPPSATVPTGPAPGARARPASARVLRAADTLQASGFGASAVAGSPMRLVVASATLEAQGHGSFAPSRRVTAPDALEAYGLGSRTERTLQRAVLPLR
jgi:hypothetical protein